MKELMSVILSINIVVINVCLSNETCQECYYGKIHPSIECGVMDDYNNLFQRLDALRRTIYCFPSKCKHCVYGYTNQITVCFRLSWFASTRSRKIR